MTVDRDTSVMRQGAQLDGCEQGAGAVDDRGAAGRSAQLPGADPGPGRRPQHCRHSMRAQVLN